MLQNLFSAYTVWQYDNTQAINTLIFSFIKKNPQVSFWAAWFSDVETYADITLDEKLS